MNVLINDYAYSLTKGFGIVKDITQIGSSKMFKIQFKNETIFDHNQDNEYSFLSNKFVSYILKKEYEEKFSEISFQRGEEYYSNKKIITFSISNNLFKGVVEGERNYSVFVSSNEQGMVSMECTCPVGFDCKHEAAFLLFLTDYLKKSIDDLNSKENNKASNYETPQHYDSALIKKIKSLSQGLENYSYVEGLFELNELLKQYTEADYVSLLSEIYRYKDGRNMKDFMQLIILNIDNLSAVFRNLKYELGVYYTTLNRELTNNQNQKFHLNFYSDERTEIIKRIKENDYSKILDFIYQTNARNSLCAALLEYIIEKLEVSEENTKTLVALSRYMNRFYMRTIVPYIKKCNFRDLRMFLSFTNNENLISKVELDKINDDTIFNEVGKISSAIEAIKYILNNINKFLALSKSKTIFVLHTLYSELEELKDKQKATVLLEDVEELAPYVLFIKNSYNNVYKDKLIKLNNEVLKGINDFEEEYYSNVLDIFTTKFIIYSTETKFVKYYKVLADDFGSEKEVIVFYVNQDNLVLTKDILFSQHNDRLIIYLYLLIEEENKDYIAEEERVFHLNNLEYLDKQNDGKVLTSIESFVKKMKEVDAPTLLPEERIKLDYFFTHMDNKAYLSLKVGNSKMFAVQNLAKFFSNFKNSEYEKYGKTFGFYHTLTNLDAPHDKILTFLMNNFRECEYSKKFMCISERMSEELFAMLENMKVYYLETNVLMKGVVSFDSIDEESEYIVSLKDYEYKININDEYRLSIDIDKDIHVINGKSSCFIFDDNEVKEIKNDIVKKELFTFAKNNNGYRVKNHLDNFVSEIYLRKPEVFEIADELKPTFEDEMVNIEVYFDFVEKAITVNKKIIKGSNENKVEIKEADLSERDKSKYQKVNQILEYLGFDETGKITKDDKILNFFRSDFSTLRKDATVYLSDAITSKKVVSFPKNEYRIKYENDLMTIFMKESSFSKEELLDIYNKIKRKKKFILLKDDTILSLDNEEAQKFEQIVKDFHLDVNDLTAPTQVPVYQALKAYAYDNQIEYDDYVREMVEKIANFKDYDLGEFPLKNTLRGYQLDGVKWLTILSSYRLGGILADDMGLGKTIQFLALFQITAKEKPSLVVCPKTLIFNWKNEFKKFYPGINVVEIYGLAPEREHIIKNIDPNRKTIYITSYDSLRNDIELYDEEFQYIVLDEAQVIKNVQALKSQSVKKLKGEVKFALTGTPIENNILDLWSIFDFILPSYFTEIDDFKDKYEHNNEYLNFIVKKVTPFILRRCKKDVLKDLPEKYERIVTVEMKNEQEKVYESFVLQAKNMLESGSSSFEVFQYLMRLRQICVDPSLFISEYNGGSAKMEYLKENLDDLINDGHKVLIFSQFVMALREIEEILKEMKIGYFMLTGDTKAEERIELCNKFNSNSEEKVFLISLKAGGNGINLVGADTVIHMDPWWNVSAENQATDRAHRIGQSKNVKVMKLIVKDSIEQRVIELQNIKKDLIDKVIANDESSITKLSIDDLKFILS